MIKNLAATNVDAWVEFPGIEGFKVHFHFLKRNELVKIRNKSMGYEFDKKTRQKIDKLDEDKFMNNYVEQVILGWTGLKIKHLPELMPVDIAGMDKNTDIPFSLEEATELTKNSSMFDQFITETLNDYEKFSQEEQAQEEKN